MSKLRAVIMPHGAREIVQSLIGEYNQSIKILAQRLGVTTRTIYRILSDNPISDKLLANIVTLYCDIVSQAEREQEQKNSDE